MRHAAGTQEIGGRKAGAGGQEPQPRETVEDDGGEAVPVGDEPGEDADEEGLFHEAGDDVVIGAPGPEERGQRHVDHDQRAGDEGDLAAQQPETAVDIGGEDPEEGVDDAGAAHGSLAPGRHRVAPEETVAGFGPDGETVGIGGRGLAQLLAAPLFGAQGIDLRH